jgi:hypothetical protein
MLTKASKSFTILGGQRRTVLSQSVSLYLEHPTLIRSHAYSHWRSASSSRPSDQYRAASAARMSALPGARRLIFSISAER